jgi:hypothetical protein
LTLIFKKRSQDKNRRIVDEELPEYREPSHLEGNMGSFDSGRNSLTLSDENWSS